MVDGALIMRTRKVSLWWIIPLVVTSLFACVPAPPVRTGKRIPQNDLQTLQSEQTTKKQIFEQFGPPVAIVGRNEIVAILLPTAWTQSREIKGGEYQEIESNTFFELFSSHEITEYHKIYYYYSALSTQMLFVFPGGVGHYQTSNLSADRLWVLLDERTGLMEDYYFRKGR